MLRRLKDINDQYKGLQEMLLRTKITFEKKISMTEIYVEFWNQEATEFLNRAPEVKSVLEGDASFENRVDQLQNDHHELINERQTNSEFDLKPYLLIGSMNCVLPVPNDPATFTTEYYFGRFQKIRKRLGIAETILGSIAGAALAHGALKDSEYLTHAGQIIELSTICGGVGVGLIADTAFKLACRPNFKSLKKHARNVDNYLGIYREPLMGLLSK